jgi:integrase
MEVAAMTRFCPTDLVRSYYLKEFRPTVERRLHPTHLDTYDTALRRFERFTGGRPRLGDVTAELVAEFQHASRSQRCCEQRARNFASCIRRIIHEWSGENPPRVEVPAPEPGTLRHYAETVYIPTRMIDCKPLSIQDVRRAVLQLPEQMGRDVRLDELDDSMIAEFLKATIDAGRSRATANNRRANLLAVWNHAFREGVIDRAPRLRKLREVRNVPEAWSHSEMKRILAAARRFRPSELYAGVRANLLWTAILLVAYETGLRRGSLFALRHEDVDLERGWIVADGSTTKTLRGQSFRISEETIAALRAIWHPPRERLFDGIKPRRQYEHFRLILEATGVKQPPRKTGQLFHRVRRTCATLIAGRAGLSAAGAQLGHSEAEVTRRYIDTRLVQVEGALVLPRLVG